MNTTGLLPLGVSEIVTRATGKPMGYAYTELSGKGFLERWLLFANPQNDFEVRPAPDTMASWSLSDWQEKVSELWQPGSYYVWAQADVYQYGETYKGVTWTEIPSSTNLPPPSFPNRAGTSYQLDWNECNYPRVHQGDVSGYGYVLNGLTRASSVEYWLLPPSYAPGTLPTSVVPDPVCNLRSLDAFVQMANKEWQTGATFCITGCENYHGSEPPLHP